MAESSRALAILLSTALCGGVLGIGMAVAPGAPAAAVGGIRAVAVAVGVIRARPPQPGDVWGGCDDARMAGTAPIYRGEPGYRSGMDGDDDGIACESRPG